MTTPAYYVKADGTVCMSFDVFRAANANDVVKALNTITRTRKNPTKINKENRDLSIGLYIGNTSDRNNG